MVNVVNKTETIAISNDELLLEVVARADQPLVIKGLVSQWPLVNAGLESTQSACGYLKSFYNGMTVGAFLGDASIEGRYFYNDDLSSLNYEFKRTALTDILDKILLHEQDEKPPSIYVGSTTVDACLPGLRAANDIPLGHLKPLVSIWLGNQSRIACHYDAPDNIACCAVGCRRVTLFPPEQIENLYPGPLDFTPAGQVISMVDFADPDYEKFPQFRDAESAGQVADLEAGDALYIPRMWWHHVEGLSSFNVLVNYWWRSVPGFMGPGVDALSHALLNIRDLPADEKKAWKHIFDYYIFGNPEENHAHIPESARGTLGPIDDIRSRKLRAHLINRLNR